MNFLSSCKEIWPFVTLCIAGDDVLKVIFNCAIYVTKIEIQALPV